MAAFTPQGFAGRVLSPKSIYRADLFIRFSQALTDSSIMYSCQEPGCDDAATLRATASMNGNTVRTDTKTETVPGTWPVDTLGCPFPQGFDSQNHSNPFNPSTTINDALPTSFEVRLSVCDMLGREVSVLVNERKEAGAHEVRFDGSNRVNTELRRCSCTCLCTEVRLDS